MLWCMILFGFFCLLLFSDFLSWFCISFFHGDGQSSLGIVNLDLDLDVLYQISFLKKNVSIFISRHESTEFEKISTNN